ncbi:MAG TPA: hypothetical protein VHD56_08715 [Tepidisphaeraceae bacterium]|nr:hypothetical protein [Tepidisphaeraceae bacterium]
MIVFTRNSNESVLIAGPADLERVLKVTVLEVKNGKVKFGLDISEDMPASQWNVWQLMRSFTNSGNPHQASLPQA